MNKKLITEAMARADGLILSDSGVTCNKTADCKITLGGRTIPTPEYFTDNEIDRMVRGLDYESLEKYDSELVSICIRDETWKSQATEDQKVEAYLKALNLWAKEMEG